MDNNVEICDNLKKIQLEILIELDRVCEKNNLRYFLAFGTLIGAIRHDGFIPWDDDIDVMMPYEDMKKLESIWKDEANEQYFFQSPNTESEYGLTINRIRKNNTLLVEPLFENKNVHKGIFIDIYPLYGAAKGKFKRKLQTFRAMKRALYLLNEPVKNHGTILKIGSSILLKLKTNKSKKKTQQKLLKKIALNYDDYNVVTRLDSHIKAMSTNYEKSLFGNGVKHIFEGKYFTIPCEYHEILTKVYGDYMKLPPEEDRVIHHDFVKISFNTGE